MTPKTGVRVLFAGGGTGGHLYPALALGDAVRRADPDAAVMFVGARRGVEARVLPERGVPHTLLPLEPIRRSRPWENWRLIPAMGRTGVGLRRVFRDFRPDVVVGTGGYASGPAVAWALLRGVPTALQEQNSYPGIVTRWLTPRVRQLHLAFPEVKQHLKLKETEVFEFGNPIQPPDESANRQEARAFFGLESGPIVLVVGGSQGARSVNEALLADIRAVAREEFPSPPEGMQILWATGPSHYESIVGRLAEAGHPDWVRVEPYIQEMPKALAAADVAISRAGAMALAELCAWGVPSILVPFPHAAADHQRHNAKALDEAGAALMVDERDLVPGALWEGIVELAGDADRRTAMSNRARDRGRPDAADRIAAELIRLADDR